MGLRNDLGLLSEEYDPVAGWLVGNFPQAFSHVSLVNSASKIGGQEKPSPNHVIAGLVQALDEYGKELAGRQPSHAKRQRSQRAVQTGRPRQTPTRPVGPLDVVKEVTASQPASSRQPPPGSAKRTSTTKRRTAKKATDRQEGACRQAGRR